MGMAYSCPTMPRALEDLKDGVWNHLKAHLLKCQVVGPGGHLQSSRSPCGLCFSPHGVWVPRMREPWGSHMTSYDLVPEMPWSVIPTIFSRSRKSQSFTWGREGQRTPALDGEASVSEEERAGWSTYWRSHLWRTVCHGRSGRFVDEVTFEQRFKEIREGALCLSVWARAFQADAGACSALGWERPGSIWRPVWLDQSEQRENSSSTGPEGHERGRR